MGSHKKAKRNRAVAELKVLRCPLDGIEQPFCEWLCGDDYLEWVRCLTENQ